MVPKLAPHRQLSPENGSKQASKHQQHNEEGNAGDALSREINQIRKLLKRGNLLWTDTVPPESVAHNQR